MSAALSQWGDTYPLEVELEGLSCLFIDVQATGASPRSGGLIELSIRASYAGASGDVESACSMDLESALNTLVMLSPPKIPYMWVTKITGIKNSSLCHSMSPEELSKELWLRIDEVRVRVKNGEKWVWTAHVARYERSFIRALCLAHPPADRSRT